MKKRKRNRLVDEYKIQRLINWFRVTREKRELLESYGWYRNLRGGYAHPHAIDYMTAEEIKGYTLPQLEFKLKNGSMARLPEELQERNDHGKSA